MKKSSSHFFRGVRKLRGLKIRLGYPWRRLQLRLRAWLQPLDLQLHPSVQIQHRVHLQGQGRLEIGEGVVLGYFQGASRDMSILFQVREVDAKIVIGKKSMINNGTELIARSSIRIGEACLIGDRVSIYDSDFHGLAPDQRHSPGETSPVEIDDNVWIGSHAIILKGVTIGRDAVIGAACVVSRSVPPGSIVVGNPMQILGSVYDRTASSLS